MSPHVGKTIIGAREFPLIEEPLVAMLRYCGMVVGIEPDGYTR